MLNILLLRCLENLSVGGLQYDAEPAYDVKVVADQCHAGRGFDYIPFVFKISTSASNHTKESPCSTPSRSHVASGNVELLLAQAFSSCSITFSREEHEPHHSKCELVVLGLQTISAGEFVLGSEGQPLAEGQRADPVPPHSPSPVDATIPVQESGFCSVMAYSHTYETGIMAAVLNCNEPKTTESLRLLATILTMP
ncbi:unnamed protein product [Heligmosomoides polygyrus]|uniref:ZP domain-containing protein n=1 Tax=Heligmosomoides polygyrus TaxID=6339 RepID=A0A183FV62_HELPZ|nr:unnamed protein product [Heligmosomoides polygyrus]